MAKLFSLPPEKKDGAQLKVRIPPGMSKAIARAMKASKYNQRQRSVWVSESICQLSLADEFWEIVAEEFLVSSKDNTPVTIVLEPQALIALNKMQETIKQYFKNGNERFDKSSIARTAIIQRLLEENQLVELVN